MTTSTSHTARTIMSGVGYGLFWGNFAVFCISMIIWDKDLPEVPDPAHGLIYPCSEHGAVIYCSAVHVLTHNMTLWLPLISILGLLIAPKKDMKPRFFGVNWIIDDPHKIGVATTFVTAAVVFAVLCLAGPQIMDFLVAHGIKSLPDHLF